MTLAEFETLVLSQQPATIPWAPVTDYSFQAREAIEGPHPDLILEVFHPQAIVDIGCGPGHLVALLRARGADVLGLDLPAFDITKMSATTAMGYDLAICREVLEHLTVREIRRAITNVCASSDRYVYITTRFAKAPTSLLDVDTSDDLDPTHITMLNQEFLRALVVLEGFRRRADLEARMDWKHLNRCLVYERV